MCKGEHWLYGDIRHYNRNPHTEKWTIYDPGIGVETDVDENTIGQFTGLCDKNGKEIYEGDIVSTPYAIVRIVFGFGSFHLNTRYGAIYYFDGLADSIGEFEVIGNVYDNPEFMEGGEE